MRAGPHCGFGDIVAYNGKATADAQSPFVRQLDREGYNYARYNVGRADAVVPARRNGYEGQDCERRGLARYLAFGK